MEMRRGSANPIRASGHHAPHKRPDTKLQPPKPSHQINPCVTGGVHTNVMFRMREAHNLCAVRAWVPPLSRPLPRAGGELVRRHVCLAEAVFVHLPHIVLSSRFVPLSPPPGCPARRDPDSRVSCAPVPAPACARFAAARIARLIARVRPRARARRRAHFACRLNRGFFAPARTRRTRRLPDTAPSGQIWSLVLICQMFF